MLPWVLTGAILVSVGAWAFWPRDVELREPQRPGDPGALIWGEGVFGSALELKAWLEARGVNYKEWARRHPDAVTLLVAEPGTVSVQPKTAKPAKPKATRPATGANPSRPAQPTNEAETRVVAPAARTFAAPDSDTTWLVIALLGLLVAVGAALAASVSKLGASSRATGVGVGLMLSGMCIGIGFAAAALLS